MANIVFNIAKGRVVEYYNRVKGNDPANSALIIMPLETSGLEADSVLIDKDDFAALVSGATNEQTTMGRKTLTDADLASLPAPDDTNDRYDISSGTSRRRRSSRGRAPRGAAGAPRRCSSRPRAGRRTRPSTACPRRSRARLGVPELGETREHRRLDLGAVVVQPGRDVGQLAAGADHLEQVAVLGRRLPGAGGDDVRVAAGAQRDQDLLEPVEDAVVVRVRLRRVRDPRADAVPLDRHRVDALEQLLHRPRLVRGTQQAAAGEVVAALLVREDEQVLRLDRRLDVRVVAVDALLHVDEPAGLDLPAVDGAGKPLLEPLERDELAGRLHDLRLLAAAGVVLRRCRSRVFVTELGLNDFLGDLEERVPVDEVVERLVEQLRPRPRGRSRRSRRLDRVRQPANISSTHAAIDCTATIVSGSPTAHGTGGAGTGSRRGRPRRCRRLVLQRRVPRRTSAARAAGACHSSRSGS
jgi:hypothetical protein